LNQYTLHIILYDAVFFAAIFVAITIALFLWFTVKANRSANRFLAAALAVVVLWIARTLAIDIGLITYFSHWSWLPLQFSLAFGPLIYFYSLKITRPEYRLGFKDLLHFSPLLLDLLAHLLAVPESAAKGIATYDTSVFHLLNPVSQVLAFISVSGYLYLSHRLITHFYREQKFNYLSDRYHYQLRWLHRLLTALCLLWLLWIPYTAVDYLYYHHQLAVQAYYPLYIILTITFIWLAAATHLRAEAIAPLVFQPSSRPTAMRELKQKSTWLRNAMKAGRYYQDPELSLASLAEKLSLSPHELSRIINATLKKSFSDFINEYRVTEVISKMQDRAYDHITLLGIAYDSGFNSPSTFHRAFKEVTGKTPAEYKKELSSYNLTHSSRLASVISSHKSTPVWNDEKLNRSYMFKNYLKNAWRHIMRHKTYSAINVMGLALGICGCLVIYLVASFEFSFDTFHPDKERIYCVDLSISGTSGAGEKHLNAVPAKIADVMRSGISGLEAVAAFPQYKAKVKITAGDKVLKTFDETAGVIAQPEYFDILQYNWLSGNKKTALANPMAVVLTQSRAITYFGDMPPAEMIGKTVTYDDSLTVTVTGILKDWNENSDFNFSDFISYSTIKSSFLRSRIDRPGVLSRGSQVFVKLAAAVKPSQIDAQFPAFIKKHAGYFPGVHTHAQLQPLTAIHFHKEYGGDGSKADLKVLYILSAVALFILLIAAVNFVNLSTAQSIQRTKDIGILKVLGSGRGGILLQFLIETFILALLAVAIAVMAVQPLLNLFADYISPGVKFHFTDLATWMFLVGIATFTTLLAGFYPARVLSAFKPVTSLKGETGSRAGNNGYLRKSLIVFQFTISLIFIIGTIMVQQQVNYMQNIDLGIKTSNIITLKTMFFDQSGKMDVLAEKIKQMPGIEQVVKEITPPITTSHMEDAIHLQGSSEQPIQSYTYSGNEDFVPFYRIKLVAGRNLLHTDSATEYLINVTAAKAMGFNDPQKAIGRFLNSTARDKAYPIVGVVADFHQNSLYQQILPCTIANDPNVQKGIALKLTAAAYRTGDIQLLVNNIAKEWKELYPKVDFDYSFLGDTIAKLYENEQRTKWLIGTATVITIFISCMGLFGLAMFTIGRKTKEISIRKVLGATVPNILTMLNKEVVTLIVISLLISSPIAWLFIHKWLQNFAYHTSLSFWIFMLAGGGAILIALITISFQTVRSAIANPVKGLRNE